MEPTSPSTVSGHQGEAEPAGDEEGSNFPVDPVCQVQDPVTRHYKRRRSNSVAPLRGAAAPPPLAIGEDSSMEAARMSILEIDRKEGIKGLREGLPTKTAIGAYMMNSDPVQTDPESAFTSHYLEHLAAGSGGITIRELFASFKAQTVFPSIWNEQVRSYLKDNPVIDEVMVEYLQLSDVQQQPERSLSTTDSSRDMSVTSNTSVPSPTTTSVPADSHPGNEGRPGVWTPRKAHKKTIESVQTKSVERMQQSTGIVQMVSASNDVTAADPTYSQQATRARKDSSDNEAQLDDRGKPTLGILQAKQAKILAETGFQKGTVRCARRDIGKNWRCPLVAMAGHTLCEHHKAKSRAKYARQKLQKRRRSPGQKIPELETGRSMKLNAVQPASTEIILPQPKLEDHAATTEAEEEAKAINVHVDRANSRSLKALHAKIRAEKGDESGVRCARTDRGKDSTRKYWQCPMNAMKGRTLCDHHFLLAEANRARYAAAQHRKKAAAAKRQGNPDFENANNNDVGLSGSHTEFHQVPAEVPESIPLKPSIDTPSQAVLDEKLEAPDIADGISEDDHDDHADSDAADQLLPHMLKNASKRWHVAPRKTTDANVKVNSHDRETSPAMNGGGRKAQLFRSLLKSL